MSLLNGGIIGKPKRVISVKPFRSLRECSIDVAPGDTVAQLHTITFVDTYQFDSFGTTQAEMQTGSLIHGNIGSQQIDNTIMNPGWYNAEAAARTSRSNEEVRNLAGDVAGQVICVPMEGCNKLSFSLAVWDATSQVSDFILTLKRLANVSDTVAFMGSPADQGMEIASWGPFPSVQTGSNLPNIMSVDPFVMPIGAQLFVEIQNITSAVNTNRIAGSIFFHG